MPAHRPTQEQTSLLNGEDCAPASHSESAEEKAQESLRRRSNLLARLKAASSVMLGNGLYLVLGFFSNLLIVNRLSPETMDGCLWPSP